MDFSVGPFGGGGISLLKVFFAYRNHRIKSNATLGSPDWIVQLNGCIVLIVPARIMQLLECRGSCTMYKLCDILFGSNQTFSVTQIYFF